MGTEELLVERDGPVLVVTLNREERMNALSEALHAALPETWQSVRDDPSIRAIVITGKGPGPSAPEEISKRGPLPGGIVTVAPAEPAWKRG